jgi:Ctr copper transporter family
MKSHPSPLLVHLVPQEAIIISHPVTRTFAEMRQAMVVSGRNGLKKLQSLPLTRTSSVASPILGVSIGCGSEEDYEEKRTLGHLHNYVGNFDDETATTGHSLYRRRLQMVEDASKCNNSTNFYCWMSCLKIPDNTNSQKYLDDGYSLYCADPAKYDSSGQSVAAATTPCNEVYGSRTIIGGAMNEACIGMWKPTAEGVVATPVVPRNGTNSNITLPENLPFCYGGTSMYMDGFHWMNPVCVIYLFPTWVLSSAGKFVAACFGTILAGIGLEGFIRKRRDIVSDLPIGWKRLTVSTICYGIQLSIGYLVMLVVMTFSAPLFLSVVIGLMSGHFLFNMSEVLKEKKEEDGKSPTGNAYEELNVAQAKTNVDESSSTGLPAEQVVPSCCVPYNEDDNFDDEENRPTSYGSVASTAVTTTMSLEMKQAPVSSSAAGRPKNKKKNIVPEGCTPCCQNDL